MCYWALSLYLVSISLIFLGVYIFALMLALPSVVVRWDIRTRRWVEGYRVSCFLGGWSNELIILWDSCNCNPIVSRIRFASFKLLCSYVLVDTLVSVRTRSRWTALVFPWLLTWRSQTVPAEVLSTWCMWELVLVFNQCPRLSLNLLLVACMSSSILPDRLVPDVLFEHPGQCVGIHFSCERV